MEPSASEIGPLGRVGVFSPGIARIPHLRALLGAQSIVFRPGPLRRADCVVGWGRKPNTAAPREYARRHGVPFFALEDGFLRSVSTGAAGDPPLSIVIDDQGIYYDASQPSRLELLLASETAFSEGELARSRAAIRAIREAGLSKYNDAPELDLGARERSRVLVVDQTAGDLSIALGGASAVSFERMLEAALAEHPEAEIVVKTHPEVARGDKRGHFSRRGPERVRWVDRAASAPSLLAQVDHVYVVSSLVGFEALLRGLPVTCFGVPFYAGWSLTDDRAPVPGRRARRRSIEELFAAAYLRYARYVDPETGERCEVEPVIEHLAEQRRAGSALRGRFVCVGFSLWKRGFVSDFLRGPESRVEYARSAADAARRVDGETNTETNIVVWGTKEGGDVHALATRTGARIWRMEDGFLRSVGLGSDLHAPASLVLDPLGIYYDPTRPSELERILSETELSEHELERARRLRERIVAARVSKYNVGEDQAELARGTSGREVALVIGQVEDDASIRLGCLDVRTNLRLLEEARRARPDAYLLWKPHPDVLSGNRAGAVSRDAALALADELVEDASVAACLDVAAEVHTMTSLVGFEALLRGRRVVAYGQPFYAGWGLTMDRHPHPRRTRRLSIDELVAGALIRYPRYVSPVTHRYTTPERVIEHLLASRTRAPALPWRASRPLRVLRQAVQLAKGALRAS